MVAVEVRPDRHLAADQPKLHRVASSSNSASST
jgi:hypothetical protein